VTPVPTAGDLQIDLGKVKDGQPGSSFTRARLHMYSTYLWAIKCPTSAKNALNAAQKFLEFLMATKVNSMHRCVTVVVT
jgi:hypothetical protein